MPEATFPAINIPGTGQLYARFVTSMGNIVIKLEEFDYRGATVIALLMLIISFALLMLINLFQAWSRRRLGDV